MVVSWWKICKLVISVFTASNSSQLAQRGIISPREIHSDEKLPNVVFLVNIETSSLFLLSSPPLSVNKVE